MERTCHAAEIVDSLPRCIHIFPRSRRHCRQSVAKPGGLLCATHAKQLALSAPVDPLAGIAAELGDLREISEVSQFLAKILKLACQNRISTSRAAALTYIANSLLNSLRLLSAEDRIAAKESGPLDIDWTGFPRPERERQNPPPSHPLPVPDAVPAPNSL
jgi:hypothetical protein